MMLAVASIGGIQRSPDGAVLGRAHSSLRPADSRLRIAAERHVDDLAEHERTGGAHSVRGGDTRGIGTWLGRYDASRRAPWLVAHLGNRRRSSDLGKCTSNSRRRSERSQGTDRSEAGGTRVACPGPAALWTYSFRASSRTSSIRRGDGAHGMCATRQEGCASRQIGYASGKATAGKAQRETAPARFRRHGRKNLDFGAVLKIRVGIEHDRRAVDEAIRNLDRPAVIAADDDVPEANGGGSPAGGRLHDHHLHAARPDHQGARRQQQWRRDAREVERRRAPTCRATGRNPDSGCRSP